MESVSSLPSPARRDMLYLATITTTFFYLAKVMIPNRLASCWKVITHSLATRCLRRLVIPPLTHAQAQNQTKPTIFRQLILITFTKKPPSRHQCSSVMTALRASLKRAPTDLHCPFRGIHLQSQQRRKNR